MKKIKGYKIVYERDGEIEYKTKQGIVSVIDLRDPHMKFMYYSCGMEIPEDKTYSVELILKDNGFRIVVELAQLMDEKELIAYLKEKNK